MEITNCFKNAIQKYIDNRNYIEERNNRYIFAIYFMLQRELVFKVCVSNFNQLLGDVINLWPKRGR